MDCEIVINILLAYQVGPFRASAMFASDIIVKFPLWGIKSKVVQNDWEQPSISVEGSSITIFPDLCITLEKRNSLKFLTEDLQDCDIPYCWRLFKLTVTYQSRTYSLRTVQEAKKFQEQLKVEAGTRKA